MVYGDFLGRAEGCFEIRNKKKNKTEKYPHFEKEIGECVPRAGSSVSVDSLTDLALWNIDTYIMTRRNRAVAVLKNLEDDSHIETRISQYEALKNGKAVYIAKEILKAKIEGQNRVLKKYNLPLFNQEIDDLKFENLESARKRLTVIESHHAKAYFKQIFNLSPEKIRPDKRVGYKAYDGLNNVFNFAYYVLRCRIHKALLKARLEPYLGFLHSNQFSKPSLVCDFQELYRCLIDDYLIQRCQKLHKNDFVLVSDFMMPLRMGKRIHLCEYETNDLAAGLNSLFEHSVNVPRIRYGNRQTLDTLINEEAYLFAQFLRHERKTWIPRMANLDSAKTLQPNQSMD
jgi:CRISPR-associated protein Cas1